MRRLSFLASVLVVVWASVAVPMPFFETRPGSAHGIEELMEISASQGAINGELSLLTIRQVTATPVDVLVAALRPGRQLEPAAQRTPSDVDLDVFLELQARQFGNAFTTALGVAAREAGYDVEVSTTAVIAQVLEGGPSDGLLESGDVVTAADGVPLSSSTELVATLAELEAGDVVELELRRDGVLTTVPVTLGLLPEVDRPGLGVIVETVTGPVQLPFDATINETNIGGPSAGMMFALTAVDLLLEEDLAAGRNIAGTGTIDGSGAVGTIGGIELKVEAAVTSGAELMLVPIEQAAAAIEAAAGRVEVRGVATLHDAVEALRSSAPVAAPAPA